VNVLREEDEVVEDEAVDDASSPADILPQALVFELPEGLLLTEELRRGPTTSPPGRLPTLLTPKPPMPTPGP
jgi:hypothetical protein